MKKHYGHIQIPLQRVHIELTNICNFNCTFCPNSMMKRAKGFMQADLAKQIISEIAKEGISEKVTFHVMGEPTLHPDFFEILEHAKKEGVNVGLTTNGAWGNKEIAKKLLNYDLNQIDISLQTPDAKSFILRQAGTLTFDNYLNDILKFFADYMTKDKGTVFKFRLLNTRFSPKSMERKIGKIDIISSTQELRDTVRYWANAIYDILNLDQETRAKALKRVDKLVSYKWNVIEIYPNVFFETYMLSDWGNAFADKKVYAPWAGYCYGIKDHFSVLWNGDVTLCCVDFDGKTALGNLHNSSLKEILNSDKLDKIMQGFERYKVVHPYCKHCLGSKTRLSWLTKPITTVLALKTLKPFFYNRAKLISR